MNPVSLLGHCMELLGQIERSRATPADVLTSSYTRARKYLGAKERRALSEIVFATLRTKNAAEHLTRTYFDESDLPQPSQALAALMRAIAAIAPAWASLTTQEVLEPAAGTATDPDHALAALYARTLGTELPAGWGDALRRMLPSLECSPCNRAQLALAACLPEWIVESLRTGGMLESEVLALGRALLRPAPLVLRSASLAQTREDLLEQFARDGIAARPTPLSPSGIVIEQRTYLLDHPLYRTGAIEVQDEGSQLVAFALAPEEDWDILDACAGAGGKTLHLAQLQRDRGHIIASDADRRRLEQLARRLKRHRYRSIHLANLDGHRSLQPTQFDAVLLDVPCTGSGTVRRAPEIKWRIHAQQLERIVAKQERILEQYHAYVRSGGVLLYATCSILPEENQRVIERFLARHAEFEPDPLAPAFERYGIALPLSPDQWQLQLLPHRHGTDGFFVARLRRR
ncbi:Ribosomal RNA small subunit methyltransferase B [bacterium HR20]|nr:Ribosomal RNA small subunit methyltransferase B [bacterium HR20]